MHTWKMGMYCSRATVVGFLIFKKKERKKKRKKAAKYDKCKYIYYLRIIISNNNNTVLYYENGVVLPVYVLYSVKENKNLQRACIQQYIQ